MYKCDKFYSKNKQKFEYYVLNINIIDNKLCNGHIDDGLEIRLLNNSLDKDTYNNVVTPVYIIYNKLCEIAKINPEEDPLNIVRVETGSLFTKYSGDKKILSVIANILEIAHNIFMRKYTREGQKQNLIESTEIFEKHYSIIKDMKEQGMNVDEHEKIAQESMVLIMKQANTLLSSSPDIRINKKILSKSEDFKKILGGDNKLLMPEENQ